MPNESSASKIPLSVKLVYTGFMAVLVPVYTEYWGLANFLWFSNIALFLGLAAVWLEHRLLAGMQSVSVSMLELFWITDFTIGLITGEPPAGMTAYMFKSENPLFVRALSLYHLVLPFFLLWLVYRLGYDRRSWLAQTALAWSVLLICYFFTDPQENVNWVFGLGDQPQDAIPGPLYLGLLMAGFAFAVYLPTHLILKALDRRWHGEPGGTSRPRHPRLRKWSVRVLAGTSAVLGLLALPLALTTKFNPPAAAEDSVTVFLLDHGRTPSLVLPGKDGSMVRYVYGDWNWYALGNRSVLDGIRALFWPTQGALGRQALDGEATEQNVAAELGDIVVNMYAFEAPREQAAALRNELERIYSRNYESRVTGPGGSMSFVHHPQHYTYFQNSNHVTGKWLRELGCEVRGPAFFSRWKLIRRDGSGDVTGSRAAGASVTNASSR